MNQAQRNSGAAEVDLDASIDRVLNGLRTVTPPNGVEHRVLRALEQRAIAPRSWRFTLPLVWTVPAASIAGIALVVLFAAYQHPRSASEIATLPTPLTATNKPVHESRAVMATTRREVARKKAVSDHISDAAKVESLSMNAEDALALSEALAPSHPAPPMPLTEQEQLLVRILRKGDPVELAMLDPKFRSSEEASSRADFDRFFPKPTSPIVTPPATIPQPKDGENK